MKKLLFTLLLCPALCNAQIEIGAGVGLCHTTLTEGNTGFSLPTNQSTSQAYLHYKAKGGTNASFYGEASYIFKKHYQFGVSFEGYEVSIRQVFSDKEVDHITVYNSLFVPKVFANYVLNLHRFDIYAGVSAGVPFATQNNSGYCVGGNIGANLHLNKHLLLFANSAIDYLSVNNNDASGDLLNHSFNAMQFIVGLKYRILKN
jgi:hypothetical protein